MAFYRWGKAILTGDSPVIYGDGSQMRDFTSVDDIVDGTILAAQSGNAVGEIFNLASGRPISVNNALETLQRALGKSATEIKREPAKPEDPPITHADVSKAKRILGYSPRHSYERTVQQFAKWMIGKYPS
jgi:UDP-glucuronate 4-epimerase